MLLFYIFLLFNHPESCKEHICRADFDFREVVLAVIALKVETGFGMERKLF